MNAAEQQAELRREFTDFSIIRARDTGRWWAVRNVQRDETGRRRKRGVSDVDADTADQLRARLQEATKR